MIGLNHIKVAAALAKQVADLIEKPSEGILVISNSSDPFTISADIHGPVSTPYEGGVFKCSLKIDDEFPQKPPKGYFLTKIFHPNVSMCGEICVNTLKKDWEPMNWSLRHIFEVIRCLLIVPFPESSLNEEAGKLFMENYDEYTKTARVYCNVYAKKKIQSPVAVPSENFGTISSPQKVDPKAKEEGVLGSLTLNTQYAEHKVAPSKLATTKMQTQTGKKWMKRI